ncbi:sdh4 [Scenedesmus sp. PABB004]|nr:sdh4 [Scenedesmus sp. PABB004]
MWRASRRPTSSATTRSQARAARRRCCRRRAAVPTAASLHAAGAVPVAALSSKDGFTQKLADWTLAVAVPVHMHITTNALVTDYVPTRFRVPARAAILGASLVTYLGIMKVNLAGPGLTETVKRLWRKEPVEV